MTDEQKCGHGEQHQKSGCSHGETNGNIEEYLENQIIAQRMKKIGQKIVVMSGKGGVGKSTVAVNIAASLAMRGLKVGLLDVDIHGPSVPRLLNIADMRPVTENEYLLPIEYLIGDSSIQVMSIGLLVPNRDDAIIWRGPMKIGVIKQFIKDVEWGELDFLIIDAPPGTGDEPLSVCQIITDLSGAIIVTTPQQVAIDDVRKSVTFCKKLSTRVLGVVENMSGFACPKCGEVTNIFSTGGGEEMARDMGVPFLGRIPIDPMIVSRGDGGAPVVAGDIGNPTVKALDLIVEPLLTLDYKNENSKKESDMKKIAVPTAEGQLCMHFGHCQVFTLFDVEGTIIKSSTEMVPPPHEPGVIPKWLHEQGATHIIAGGMGSRAQDLFRQYGITVVTGASADDPEVSVRQFIDGTLVTGANVCDH